MSLPIALAFTFVALGVLLGLVELWSGWFAPDLFVKLMVTDGALLALLVAWALVARERRETERLRRDKTFE